jgi:hypothetical protein
MLEVISVLSALAGVGCIIVVMASERLDFGWIAAGCFGSFISLRAVALGLRMLDDIRGAIVASAIVARASSEHAGRGWGQEESEA